MSETKKPQEPLAPKLVAILKDPKRKEEAAKFKGSFALIKTADLRAAMRGDAKRVAAFDQRFGSHVAITAGVFKDFYEGVK